MFLSFPALLMGALAVALVLRAADADAQAIPTLTSRYLNGNQTTGYLMISAGPSGTGTVPYMQMSTAVTGSADAGAIFYITGVTNPAAGSWCGRKKTRTA